MPTFSESSKDALGTCHRALKATCRRVIEVYDFAVIEGHRGKERQNRLVQEGRSKVEWPNSKHNATPSRAVDIAPYPIDWDSRGRFHVLAGHMMMAFHGLQQEGEIDEALSLRWGGDWDGDGELEDQQFDDLPHFELV
jgi:peptidoglycan L-alanyl-D-glutamate endopeptidase CwlK